MFVENGQIFGTIDRMVDLIFNRYIRRQGHLEPFFAEQNHRKNPTRLKTQ